jgi:uncharacterized protein (DUF2062 family)
VIVRAAWKGIQVKNIPIKVHYDLHDRVSHFRPFKDFSRISVLNTVLVVIALMYIKPRDFFRNLKKKDLKRILTESILESKDSNLKKSLSIALGVFLGLAPIWGFQTVAVLGSAFLLRLNKLIAFTFSNISLPPLIPFIIYGSLKIGSVFTGSSVIPSLSELSSYAVIKQNLTQYIIGSFILAASMSLLFGLCGYLILSIPGITKNKKVANA